MPQDAFTLSHLCREFNDKFKGGKINKIVQYDEDRISFTVYTGKRTEKLNISVKPSAPRIWVGEVDFDVPLTALNFCMLLRKHLQNATIKQISLVDFDRIVKIDFSTGSLAVKNGWDFFDPEMPAFWVTVFIAAVWLMIYLSSFFRAKGE